MRIKDIARTLHKQGDDYVELYISNMDVSGTSKYYGYVTNAGYWVIMEWNTTTNVFLYAYGQEMTSYSVNWNVAGAYVGALTFKTADEVF
jgi:hypothetical protein